MLIEKQDSIFIALSSQQTVRASLQQTARLYWPRAEHRNRRKLIQGTHALLTAYTTK